MAVIGTLTFLAGIVALIKPSLLRLPNRWWALGIIFLGSTIAGMSVTDEAARDRVQDEIAEAPLYWAVVDGNVEAVKRLLAEGADPNVKDIMGWSTVIQATREDNIVIVQHLLEAGADPNAIDKLGWAALHHAILRDHANIETISVLVRYGANVNVRDKSLRTPLHRAAQFGHVEAVQHLLQLGADRNAKDENGWTALDRGRTHVGVVRLLEGHNQSN